METKLNAASLTASLTVKDIDDVDRVAKRITENGGRLLTEPADMPWGARAFRIEDPDGFKFAVSTGV